MLIECIISAGSDRSGIGGDSNNLQEFLLKALKQYFSEGDKTKQRDVNWSCAAQPVWISENASFVLCRAAALAQAAELGGAPPWGSPKAACTWGWAACSGGQREAEVPATSSIPWLCKSHWPRIRVTSTS